MESPDPWTKRPDESAAGRRAMLNLLRGTFLILLIVFTSLIIVTDSTLGAGGIQLVRWWPLAVVGVLVFFAGVVALDVLTPKRKLSTVSAMFVGLIAGVIVAAILGLVMDLFVGVYGFDKKLLDPFKILLGLGICYLTISTVLQTQDDFRLVIPYVEFARKIRGARPFVLDTSVLIDGRIQGVVETGLIQSPMVVPRFVVEELQRLSDSGDRLKRARGRRGLEMISRLQRIAGAEVSIEEASAAGTGVDQMIVDLARTMPATVLTTDGGLARVAVIQGAPVVNLNDLAAAMKSSLVPGEQVSLAVIRRGEQPGQGVGYLDDGTMVVIEDGEGAIGKDVSATVTSSMQTSAGRLIFARIGASQGAEAEPAAEGPALAASPPERSPSAARGSFRPMRNPRRG